MDERERLARRFEEHRGHLRAVAYRMLGSLDEADDAVQEAWLRLSRSDVGAVENLAGWLTTVIARICLNMLRARRNRPEDLAGVHVPDPIIDLAPATGAGQPEQEALLAEAVGLALITVLDTLAPAERLAFVLHDLFDLSFDEIAPMVGRSPAAARQLASRARRRVRALDTPVPDADHAVQRRVVDAFFAAARGGDVTSLVAVLDPDVVLRADGGAGRPQASAVVRGARDVARRALLFAQPAAVVHPVLVNGTAGVVITIDGRPVSVMGFVVADERIAEIHALVDAGRLARLDLPARLGLPAQLDLAARLGPADGERARSPRSR
ncbi:MULTISPECIES: sigma-70 family RNA polymerase sigma factor [Frankia]|uniref:RNA polymerase ECF-subfamily sigma factor n=1 Tax=Frankia alni (strain DSM 45986 / CECT 9034 / ACN14a) TaxID=326424 RepID=Q0RIK7_FRAAA|nr:MULTISPECIES: sigma-70 family RNA polymerase sigma factor [Frankia]CAJ62661.1 putative RNA polymerase ECF-subfamily sigma factor [Frankia alni ACN14a]